MNFGFKLKFKSIAATVLKACRRLPAETVDLVFADPPFNIGLRLRCLSKIELDSRKIFELVGQDWMAEIVRILTPTGTFWLAIGDEYAAETQTADAAGVGLVLP